MVEDKKWILKNKSGIEITVLETGGAIQKWLVPVNGTKRDIVLGFEKASEYSRNEPSFGAIIGRYANRINQGKFVLNEIKYELSVNHGENHLHGGFEGFARKQWTGLQFSDAHLRLSYFSPDGEEGYPGNVDVRVDYRLMDDHSLVIKYWARSDQDTVINLTQHSYFNLDGHEEGSILDHSISINSREMTENNENMIPTGRFKPFEQPKNPEKLQNLISRLNGVDHNFILVPGDDLKSACEVFSSNQDVTLEVKTTEPGLQVFTSNFANKTYLGKGGVIYREHCGIALETQHYPDSPNHPDFPSTVLKAGKEFRSETVFMLRF